MPLAVSKFRRTKESVQAPRGGYAFLSLVLDGIDLQPLLEALGPPAPTGRPGYPAKAMLRLVLAKYVLGIRFNLVLLDRARASPRLREVCGLTRAVPSEATFSKFTTRLIHHQDVLNEVLDTVTTQLRGSLPGDTPPLGEAVAIDSTAVESWSNPNRTIVTDPEARWGVKHSARAKDGKTEFFFGYRVMVADANQGVPLDFFVTPGNAGDSPLLPHLLDQMRETLPWVRPKVVIGDRGYDAKSNYAAVARHGAVPVIHIRNTGTGGHPKRGIRTKRGIPSCQGWQTMEYVRTDPDTGHHLFRCPEGGCHLQRVASGGILDCRSEVWVQPEDDLREMGYIMRGSDEWVGHYAKRQAIERVFRSLKASRNLEGHYYRGLSKILLHTTLSVLSFQATALARCATGDFKNLRQMRVKVG